MREGVAFRASPVPLRGLAWIDSVEEAWIEVTPFVMRGWGVSCCRWARLWKLLVLVTVIVGLVALGSFGVIVSVKQVRFTFHIRFCCLASFCDLVVLFLLAVCLVGCFDGAMRTKEESVCFGGLKVEGTVEAPH